MFEATPDGTPPSAVALAPVIAPPASKAPLLAFGSLLDAFAADADARHLALREGRYIGPVTGLTSLDRELGGALAPGLHIVHGSPGVGKTAFALQTASSCGCPALYVTCEMTPMELLRRHTARVTSTFLGKFKSGEMAGSDALALARRAVAAAPLLALMDATAAPAPIEDVLEAAERTRAQRPDSLHLLVVIDSLHSWADGLGSDVGPEYDRLNLGLAQLRTLAKRLDCPVLVIAERNRQSMGSSGQNAGAGTRKIEYGAESVMALDAENGAQADGAGEISVDLKISKNRNGSAGRKIELLFNGALQQYREMVF